MLEFFKDGKKININSIHGNGKVNQMVVYGQDVDWGPNASPTVHPLSQYLAPSVFTIVQKDDGFLGSYTLKDSNGNCIKIDKNDAWYLYDAQEWLTWQSLHQSEKIARKQKKIELLESHLGLLKDILIKQGTHIITKEQADALNL